MRKKSWLTVICCLLLVCLLPSLAMAKNKTKAPARDWKLTVAQQKLELLGYDVDRKDGRISKDTAEAIKKFQKEHGLKKSGKLDTKTYNKISWEAFKMEGIPDVRGKDIVKTAAKYKGVPYKFGGTTPKGFDCSAYVQYVFGRHDAKLPRTADAQVLDGIFVLKSKLKPGDLVFFSTYASGASHVGIYAGSGKFWSASTSRGVVLDSLDTGYWKEHYYGARRVLIENGETA
ncbi:MAG TPA: C40 family peptidase [Candidatus Phascolarctobacterium stercoravium]|nr:C40 family peptidase [Candidatus Phascolarctobacterium stercoravium]